MCSCRSVYIDTEHGGRLDFGLGVQIAGGGARAADFGDNHPWPPQSSFAKGVAGGVWSSVVVVIIIMVVIVMQLGVLVVVVGGWRCWTHE